MATEKLVSSTRQNVTSEPPSDNECSICHELFTMPKLLPCGHVLCRHCLVTWLQSQPQAHCPLCRCPVVEPDKETAVSNNWDVVADGFPNDLAMEELVEAERLLKKDHQCVVCEDVAATSLCLDCGDLMCTTCKKAHKKFTPSKHHRVEDLSCLTADQLTTHCLSPCPAHVDKARELYCPSHDASMCTVCFVSRHRSCPDVTDLHQKGEESRAVLQQLATKLIEAEKKIDQALTDLDQRLQDKEKKSKASLAELKAACDRLKSAIDAYYQNVEQREEKDRSDVSKAANDVKACLSQRRGRVTSERGAVERAKGTKKHDTIMAMTSVMEKRIGDLDLSATLPDSVKVVPQEAFWVDDETVKRIEQELPKLYKNPTQWCFHTNHGKNIVLSNHSTAAERVGQDDKGGIVLGDTPMAVNHLYEIRLVKAKAEDCSGRYMYSGVVRGTPSTIDFPYSNQDNFDWKTAVVIRPATVHIYGIKEDNKAGQNLKGMPVDSRLGVLIDHKRSLHLYINGQDQGVAAHGMADPSYPMFEVFGPYRKITALPATIVK